VRQLNDRSTFNCLTVDGDMSTNDTVAILANGAGGAVVAEAEQPGFAVFRTALEHVTRELAKMIARDGERATKFVEIRVTGAADFQQARRVGRAIGNYTLLKAALFGEDFNWGRLAAAVGACGEPVDPAEVTLSMAGVTPWRKGRSVEFDLAEARRRMAAKEIFIEVDLGIGEGEATVWTCDFSPGYVEYNAEYETSLCGDQQAGD